LSFKVSHTIIIILVTHGKVEYATLTRNKLEYIIDTEVTSMNNKMVVAQYNC